MPSFHSIASWETAGQIIEDAIKAFGRIDAVVNNAGILRDIIFHKMKTEGWDLIRSVNLGGYFYVASCRTPCVANSDCQPADGLVQFGREDGVAIMQQVGVLLLVSHRLPQSLQRSLRTRMRRHVNVNQSTDAMLDDDEHVQHSKHAGYRDTEITLDDGPCMIAKKGRP